MEDSNCPCISGRPYTRCCGPYLAGDKLPPTPEALMRSRYTAFVKKDADYLVATFAPEKRAGDAAENQLRRDLETTMASTRWVGLTVVKAGGDQVEFAAFYLQEGGLGQLHERSNFIREEDRWYYRDGEMLPPVKLSRNQPCICGSGLKFKRCHG
ncbi:MAG: SEC-C domain-containing protein [Desulfobacterales bacterium]|nr:SEC-C domain-containing protein [Desulfobacterales bacterium]